MGNKRLGDRRDGRMLRDIDGMHVVMPIIYPGRCDNEAFISERFDLTKLNAYLEKKNSANPDYRYNVFQAIVTAVLKVLYLRPKMNYFIANKILYERNEHSASFIIKKQFSDNGAEGMAFLRSQPEWTIDDVNRDIYRQVTSVRGGENNSTMDALDFFTKIPRWLTKFIISILCWMDKHGWVPQSLIDSDPYYSSVVLTNLGSIKLHSGYHHLTNWGTNSFFVAVGEMKLRPFADENGNTVMKDSIDLGLTIDERIADGYYYSKTMRLVRKIFENPEILDLPLGEEFEY